MSKLLIVVEGLDGTGKSTLIASLCDLLDAKLVSNPPEMFDSRISESELRTFFDNSDLNRRREYYRTANFISSEIALNMLKNSHVIMDRYWPSTAAFSQMDENQPDWENLGTYPIGFVHPDVVFLLTVDEVNRAARIMHRGEPMTDEEVRLSTLHHSREQVLNALREFNPIEIDTSNLTSEEVLTRVIDELEVIADHKENVRGVSY